jgi:hypothetical protein
MEVNMKSSDIKKSTQVVDKFYPENGIGVITSIKRTVLRVKYENKTVQYDINKALNDLEVSL